MNEYIKICSLVCTNIYKALSKRVRGYIAVHAEDGTIFVKIKKDDFTFNYEIPNLDVMIASGYDPQACASQIVKAYTGAILKKYLKS